MPEVKMEWENGTLKPDGDDISDAYTLGRQVAHEYYSSATQEYINAASAAAQVEAEARKDEVDKFREEQSKKQTEGKAAESSFAGMMLESLAGRGGAEGTASKGPMFGKVAAEGGGGGWGDENAPAAMQGATDKVQAEVGGLEDPMVDPAMAGAAGAGGAFKMSMAMGLKLVPSVARALTAGVVSAGTDYPIGAGADAVGATSPALALPFALTVGLLSGAGVEPIIERGILKAAASAGKKLNPAQLAEQVKLMRGVLANEAGQVDVWHGSPHWKDKVESDVAEGWYVHGRRNSDDLMSEFSKHEIYVSSEANVADMYSGRKGSIWQIRPKNEAKILDANDDNTVDNVVGKLFRDYNRGDLDSSLRDIIDLTVEQYGRKEAFAKIKETLQPKDIVEDEGLYSDTAFFNWLYENYGFDFVKANRGGLAINPEMVDIRKVFSKSGGVIDDLTKKAVIEEINAEVGNRPLDEALKLLKDQRGATSMLPGAGPLDPVPVKGGSKKSGVPKPPAGDTAPVGPNREGMVKAGQEFLGNTNPDITQEMAGNIRLWGADLEPKFMGEIESPEDIMRVISGTHEAFADQTEAARRGVRSWDETAAEAKKYGIEDLLGRRLGQALNAEQIDNARTLLVSSADTLKGMAAVIRSGQANDLQKADFMRAFNTHYAIQMQLAGAAAEAGRALNIFRRVAQADAISVSKVKDFLTAASLDKRVGPEALADAISSMESPAQVAAFVKQAKRATTWDMFVEAWINGLLSGPTTHAVNVTSNLLTSLWVIPERLLAAGISRVHGGEIRMGEAAAQSFGLIQGFKDGLKLAGQALRTGEGAFDASSKIEGSGRRAITAENIRELPGIKKLAPNALDEGGMAARAVDLLGEGVRLPGRFLTAEDDFFKAIGYRMELQALAYRKGVSEGLSGDDLSKRIREIVSDPQKNAPEVHLAAIDAAKYQTYTNDLEAGGRGIQTAANKIPGLKLIIPFIRTPANILKFAVERTVLAPMMKNVRADIAAGGARRDMALAKISMGSMTMATVGALAAAGYITGGGPSDTALRSHLMNQGWQPYSIKIGDKYYAYGRLEPIGLILGLAADAVDIMGEAEDMDTSELAAVISVAAAKNVTSKTWLRGLSDVVAALEDPDRYGEAYLQRFAGSAVPSAVAQVERTIDPEMSEVRSYVDAIKARTPGFSKDLPTRRNLWGEKITFNGALGPDIVSPIFTSSVKESPIDAELVKLKAPIRMPQRKQTFEGVPLNLTPQEYDEFVVRMNDVKLEDTNKNLKKSLNELVTKDRDYKSAEDEIKVKMIRGYIEEAVSKARIEMLESDSNLRALVDEGHRQAEAAAQ
jgi:hypothetical protein